MICPFCAYDNIGGEDECVRCGGNLSSLDGVVPKNKIEEVLMNDPIARLEPHPPLTVDPQTSVQEAVKKMTEAKIGCLLVVSRGDLAGILTERDILFKIMGTKKDLSKTPVSALMTPNPQTLSEDDTLAYALNMMSVRGFRHIPIVRNGKPVGIISVRDVLKYLSKLFP